MLSQLGELSDLPVEHGPHTVGHMFLMSSVDGHTFLTVAVIAACLGARAVVLFSVLIPECRRKFLLQPIIENAVVHGLGRGKIKNTEIKVKVWADEDLHILVEDRGVGFDVEEWRRKPGKKEEHTNIGIHNVEEMIHMEYGENYGMWIESRPGEGTRVTYLLPVVRGKKHDTDNYSG